ncbi:MAG: ferritin family protein, partial [Thermodesulfobacteriota bacterium]
QAVMEGGRSVDQFLSRIRAEFLTMADIFDLALMFETQAMDLYSRLARQAEEPSSRKLFLKLVEEEKTHLGYLEAEYVRIMDPDSILRESNL